MSDERGARLDEVARLYEEAAQELDRAAGHCRVSAEHLRGGEVPRGAAHAWAAFGHAREALDRLEQQAREHAKHSRLPTA
ncbi:MAG TPA: hypothetical protein VLJ76_08845 [Gaiellaceae bacterium]|nr:hypothetical protein [Gaiellaceae bacterium]